MRHTSLSELRRQLAVRGLTPASVIPEASGGRAEEACLRPARLVEGEALAWRAVATPEAWPGTLAFLDGVQRSQLLAYAGSAPILVGEVGAAVRERRERRLSTVLERRVQLVIGRPAAPEARSNLSSARAIASARMDGSWSMACSRRVRSGRRISGWPASPRAMPPCHLRVRTSSAFSGCQQAIV